MNKPELIAKLRSILKEVQTRRFECEALQADLEDEIAERGESDLEDQTDKIEDLKTIEESINEISELLDNI